jgi:ribosomal protein S5
VAKKILRLAGVKDCWAFTSGKTKTTVNYAKAVFNALKENTQMRVMNSEINKIGIISGSLGITAETEQPIPPGTEQPTPPEEAK